MILIHGTKDSGKTRELVIRSHKTGAVIVCSSQKRAENTLLYAKHIGVEIPKPMSVSQLQKSSFKGHILIDDVQDVFRELFGCYGTEVDAVTLCTADMSVIGLLGWRGE